MAEEGKDLGPEEHSIKVFLSGNSGNKEVRKYSWYLIQNGMNLECMILRILAKHLCFTY